MRVVYVIGAPGSGKSTAVSLATRDWEHIVDWKRPFAHSVYVEGVRLGRTEAQFPGTDTLSMSVNPLACEFVQTDDYPLCVAEGDRLANAKFLDACPSLTLIHLDVSVAVARERARKRAEQFGSRVQDESWWKGRVTKVDNLRARFPHVSVDGSRTSEAVAADVREIILRP
jgi:dephospho-CoA kinase